MDTGNDYFQNLLPKSIYDICHIDSAYFDYLFQVKSNFRLFSFMYVLIDALSGI